MMWKFVRRRTVVVAALPVVLAAVVVAVAGGSGAKTTGNDATRAYGIALGARRLRLRNPDRNLLWYYQLLGFEVVWNGDEPVYCEQEI